jgi:hypothetical protein
MEKKLFFVGLLYDTDKRARSGSRSVSQKYGSKDPDPYQNVTDPEYHL